MQKNISKTTQKVVVILIMSVIFGVVLFSPVWALETGKASPIDNAPNLTIKLADWLTDKTNEITTLFKESLESINEFIEEKVNKLEISINNRVEKASKHNLLTAGTSSQEVDSKGPIHQASLVKESGSSMEASLPRGPASGQVLGESIEQGNIFSRIWNKVTDTVSKVINPSSIPPQDKAKVLPSKTAEETQEVKTGTAGEKEAISPYTEVSEDKPVSAQTTATSPSSAGRPATITQIIEKTTTSQAPAIDINAIALKAIELIADQNIYVKTSQYLDNFSEKEKTKKSDNLGANTLTITGQTDLQGPIINSLGDLNVNDNLTSTGLITAPNLNITGSATISGTLTAGSFSPANITTASLNVTRGATIQGSLSVSSFISTGHLSTDSIGISGIMSAKGVSAGESGLSTSGDTYLSGDGIYISGLVDLDNYLDLDISSAQALTIGDGTTNTLVVDTASGAVTITGSLAITGNQAFTGYQTVTASSTTPALTITQTGTGDLLNLFDNTTEVFTVLDGGNVGIGTSSPMYKLAVQDGRVYIKNSIADANNDVYGIDVYASSSAANDYVYSSYFIAQGGYESNGVTGWAYDADYNYGVTAYADGSATENYGIYSSTDTGSGGTVTSAYGIYTEAVSDSLLTSSSTITNAYGLYSSAEADSFLGATAAITNAYGLYSTVTANAVVVGTSTITNAYGIYSQVGAEELLGNANITNAYNLYLDNYSTSWGGNLGDITNNYALYIEEPTLGSTNYALYSAGGTNYFGGNVGIGTTTPNWLTQIAGTRPTLTLSDTSAATNNKHWLFSSMGGNLYIGTSTDSYATSTPAALTILNNGNIGIGTSSPGQVLAVAGSIYSGSGGFILPDGTIIDGVGDLGKWATSGSNIYYNTGNVGIGTSTPNWLTQIAGTRPSLALSDTSATANNKHWLFSSMGGSLYIGTSTDSYATSTPSALTILNNGNVGIGTSSPGQVLAVAGSIYSGSGGFILPDGTVVDELGDLGKWTTTGSDIYYTTGNVGIGTTTPNWKLQIAGTRPSLTLSDTSASANNKHWLFSSMGGSLYIGTSTDSYGTSTPSALTILNNGNIGIGTSSPSQRFSVSGSIYTDTSFIFPDGTIQTSAASPGFSSSGGLTILSTVTDKVGIGSTSPTATLSIQSQGGQTTDIFAIASSSQSNYLSVSATGLTTASNFVTNSLVFTSSSTAYSTLTSYGGFNGYINASGGFGTGGNDSVLNAERITAYGNLVNIGSIQAGQIKLTTGGTFAADVAYGAGSGPYSVAIGDLNSDSKADLAVVNNSASNVSILLNNGDGTFAADVLYGIGTDSTGVAISDLNGDGKADLAISNWSDDNVSVLLNSGDGTFAADVLYDVGSGPQSIAIGDLNGDGKIDLAVANTGGNVSVLLNNGDGTFAAVVPYGAGTTPFSVAIGDLNGDGKADLAVANNSSANISVLLNKGDGTFAADVLYGAETNPQSIAIGDLNGDGEADLAVANYNSNNVSVLLNNGDGTFAADVLYGAGTNPRYIAIGDLNGDGEADLAVANGTTANVSVLLNNGDGTFAAGVLYGAGTNPRSIAIGNLNSDGKLDLAVANNGANVSVLLNNANPLFYAGKIGGYSATTSLGAIGIGTTTPNWLTQIAGTRPTLTLSDTSAGTNLKHWLFSSMGGNLYIGTSTDSYATSTPAALTILNGGNIGIGAASPGTMLQIGNDSSVLSGFFDVTAKGFAILPNVDYARFLIEGNSDATITLIDQGGTANNRSFMIQTDGTATKFRSIKDDTTAQKDTLMTFNHSTGYVGIGIADASTLLHIGSQSSVVSGIFDASTQGLAILPNIDYARLLVEGNTDATITLVDRGGTANNRAFMIQTDGTSTKFRSIQDNTLAQADNIMVFNHTSGNVGIGTTDPDQLLDVRGSIVQGRNAESAFSRSIGISDYVGDAATTISGMRIENEADGDTVLHFQTGEWGVQGPTPRMTILETGNVGIGTESPTTPLHIYEANATTNSIVDMLHFQLISTGAVANGFGSGIKWTMEDADDAAGEEQGRINLLFTDKTAASEDTAMTFTVQKAGRLTETMRLVSGHVGIGSTTPYAPLSIASTTNILEDLFVIATSTVAGNTNTVFKVDSYGNYHYDGSATTPAADYAEYYFTIDTDLESGEVVCVDIERENAVKRCTRQADPNIMGIVSTKPAIVGNSKTSYINNPKYKIIGMLGQVPAKVSTENGAIRPGDSLTSASIPGYLMRSGAGDPTVGVALEGVPGNDAFGPLARSDRYINVLISRRNKSITVEEVEDKITDRIAAMEIEDEVNILISDAIDNLNLNDEITVVVDPKLLMLSTKLTVTTNDLGTRISNTEDQLYVISNKLLDLNAGLGQVRDNVNEITNNQSSISKQLSIINKQLENIYIDGEGNIKLGQSVSTSTAVAVVEITTKEDNTNTALVINQVGNGDIADFQKNKVSVVNISSQGKVSIVGELMVDGRIMACAGGSCGQALNNAVDETMGDLGVEGKVVAGAYEGYCDNGFIWVPGSSKYGTMPGFCVMKTKAGKDSDNKIVARDPIATLQDDSSVWTEISQGEAELACQNLGLEYHLISDNEWLTIAENIIKVSANDIDLEAEGLQLAIADSEYILTNDNSIYEFSSTVAEWTSQIVTKKGCLEMATQDEWQEYAEVIDYRGFDIAPPYYLNHKENNIGKIKIGDNDDNLRGFVRGLNGIYSIDLSNTPTTKNDEIGFRCAR